MVTKVKKRSKRVAISVTEDVYDAIVECAEFAGVSINAWSAVVLGQTARTQLESRKAILATAQAAIGEAFDLNAIERMMREESESES